MTDYNIRRAASYGHAFQGSAPGHITPSMPNWDVAAEHDLLTFGDRVGRAWDNEAVGWGALEDLSYVLYMKEQNAT